MNRFAALIGISGSALCLIENGRRNPRPETLKKITDALGCEMRDVAEFELAAKPTTPKDNGDAGPCTSDAASGTPSLATSKQ